MQTNTHIVRNRNHDRPKPPQSKAYREGERAGLAGVDTTACPYRSGNNANADWFNGYRHGRQVRETHASSLKAQILRAIDPPEDYDPTCIFCETGEPHEH